MRFLPIDVNMILVSASASSNYVLPSALKRAQTPRLCTAAEISERERLALDCLRYLLIYLFNDADSISDYITIS
jgi:hypothetical protein